MRLIKRLLLLLCLAGINNVYAQESSEPINLNTAKSEQLIELKGVGKSKSMAIIEYRESHGAFKNIEQIVLVPGIGEKIYLDNKDKLFVE